MPKYRMQYEQAAALALHALESGISEQLIPKVLELADKAYFLGRTDQSLGIKENRIDYAIDIERILKASNGKETNTA